MNGGIMVSVDEIFESFDSYLKIEGSELYDLNVVNHPNISKVEAFVYSEEDIDLETTTRFNRQFQRILEDLGFEKGSFEMIVSSPGVERKIKNKRHFELSVGELLRIKTTESINGEYVFEGFLEKIENDNLFLNISDEVLSIDFKNVKSAKLEYKKFKQHHLSAVYQLFAEQGVVVNMMRNTATKAVFCLNNDAIIIPKVIAALEGDFNLTFTSNVELLTIRHYNESDVIRETQGLTILQEQRTPDTVQFAFQRH